MAGETISRLSEALNMQKYGNYNRMSRPPATPTSLSNFISPFQFQRMAHDIGMWRDGIREAELAYNRSRVKMNRMYIDSIENGYVKAVFQRWKELTLQRDFFVYNIKDGKKINSDVLTATLNETSWFQDYLEYALEAIWHGYTLISLGDIVDDGFPDITSIQRENVNPDGAHGPMLTNMIYSVNGVPLTKVDPRVEMCNHYITTKPQRVSRCGYGLLYNISFYEIHLRHALEWNADYVETYGMPIKKGKTNKTGSERKKFESFLANAASNQWILLDNATNDDVEYEMAKSAGTAWKSYENFEQRLEDKIAQLALGHTDAMKSTPGKLGGMQAANKDGFNESVIGMAINAKQVQAGNFLLRKINETSAPLFRRLGKYVASKRISNLIPEGYYLGLLNDKEEQEVRRRTNAHRLVASEWVKNLNDAGWDVDGKELSTWVGVKLTPSIPEKKVDEVRTNTTTIVKADEADVKPTPDGNEKTPKDLLAKDQVDDTKIPKP